MSRERSCRRLSGCMVIFVVALVVACKADGLPEPSVKCAESANRALKASLELPVLPVNMVAVKLMNAQYGELEREYRHLFDEYQRNVLYESPLQKGYDLFFPGNAVSPQYIEAWVSTTGSDVAYAARGYYKMAQAGSARGHETIAKTPDEDLRTMQRYCDEAAKDLRKAVEQNPKLMPAWVGMVRIAMMANMAFTPDEVFEEGLRQDPRSVYLRMQFMKCLEPRWGGSYDAMVVFAQYCAKDFDLNPRLWPLVGSIYADMAGVLALSDDYRRAAELYSQALLYGDKLDWLQYRSDALIQCGEYEQALADAEKILQYSPDHKIAPQLAGRIRKLQAARQNP